MGKKEHERRGGKIQSTDDPGGSCRWVPLDRPQLPPMDPPQGTPTALDRPHRPCFLRKLRGGEHCKPSVHQRCNWGSRDMHAAQENAPRDPHTRRGLERHFFAFLCLFFTPFFGTLGGHLLEGPFLPPEPFNGTCAPMARRDASCKVSCKAERARLRRQVPQRVGASECECQPSVWGNAPMRCYCCFAHLPTAQAPKASEQTRHGRTC